MSTKRLCNVQMTCCTGLSIIKTVIPKRTLLRQSTRSRDLTSARVGRQLDLALVQDVVESGPAAAALVLLVGAEERLGADDTGVSTRLVVFVVAT